MTDDLLVAGARRSVPRWLASGLVGGAVLAWAVLAAPGGVVDGHGSRPEVPVHPQYQPFLGRPVY